MSQPLLDGRYRLLNELGRGGMATVYLGVDMTSGRQVAVKVLQGVLSPSRRERFLREGQVLGALRHPAIVAIHNAGEFQGRPYLVMELVEGARELSDAWKGHSLEQRVQWLIEVGNALGAAHAAGIVHRDVKPSNILIDQEGRARLTDFGIAVAGDQERLTRTGQLVGTPHWMAPEVFQSSGTASAASDVWSLGVLLYEALTNKLPFTGDTIHQLVGNLAHGYVTPRTLSREIPRDLETVCMCALSTTPARRYKDGAAFADDLGRFLRNEPVKARRGWRKLRPGTVALLAVAALGIATAGGVAWTLTRPEATTEEPEQRLPQLRKADRMNSVVQFGSSEVQGQGLPTLEALQPWAIAAGEDGIRLRFNGKTSPELRVLCRYDGATAFGLSTRLRVPLLLPTNRVGVAFQRWDRDANPIDPEHEQRAVNDYLFGSDNLEREALYLELACVSDGSFFGRYELRAGTHEGLLWSQPLELALGPDRELELQLRFDPKVGAQVEVNVDGQRVSEGEFDLPSQPKGEWLLRAGANLTYTPTTRFGVWQASGAASASGRVDLVAVGLAAVGRGGVRVLEVAEGDPRHELGRLGRSVLRPEPDFEAFDTRCQELGRLSGEEFTREELWVAGTARYMFNLSLGARGLEEQANEAWQRDFASYHIQGAGPKSGKLGWLGWRWAHDMAFYDEATRRAVARAYVRVWAVESTPEYLRRLIDRGALGTWEGAAIQRFPSRSEFEVRRWAAALALSALPESRSTRPSRSEVAFVVGAYEFLDGFVRPDDFPALTPRREAKIRLAHAVAALAAGEVQRALEELARAPANGTTPQLSAARTWIEQLVKTGGSENGR